MTILLYLYPNLCLITVQGFLCPSRIFEMSAFTSDLLGIFTISAYCDDVLYPVDETLTIDYLISLHVLPEKFPHCLLTRFMCSS